MNFTDDEVLKAAKDFIKAGGDLVDAGAAIDGAKTDEERAFANAMYAKMADLIQTDFSSGAVPPLEEPDLLRDGSMRFRANNSARRQQAEEAYKSRASEIWPFAIGDGEDFVTGRVTAAAYRDGVLYFTCMPEKAEVSGPSLFN